MGPIRAILAMIWNITMGTVNDTWPRSTVNQDSLMPNLSMKMRRLVPMMMPGRMYGSSTRVRKTPFPGKCTRVTKNAPDTPSTTAMLTAARPMTTVCRSAARRFLSRIISSYHFSVTPCMPTRVLVGLNEKIRTITRGK